MIQHSSLTRAALAASVLAMSALVGCESAPTIRIDGSSTVFPISQAAAETFGDEHGNVQISVGQSGTSAGMGKFLLGEIDICDASRPIKEVEIARAKEAGIDVIEFVIAQDGLAVVVNPENDWCDAITVEELKAIWRPEADGSIVKWSQVNPDWSDEPLKLFGPGTASGTFEYFTEVVVGEKKSSRPDYTKSENDNTLVSGVAGEKGGLGYFGFAYYAANKEKLKLLAVDDGSGPVKPSDETVKDGSYTPLSRPLFIYVSRQTLKKPAVAEFVKYYVENAAELALESEYVPVADDVADENAARLEAAMKPVNVGA